MAKVKTENIASRYFTMQKELFAHVGFKPDWVEYALDDVTEYYWKIDDKDVYFAEKPEYLSEENLQDMDNEFYSDNILTSEAIMLERNRNISSAKQHQWRYLYRNEIYTQRFYPQWVYRGEEVTLIFCDPHVDGCKWFRIFDNTKEIKE